MLFFKENKKGNDELYKEIISNFSLEEKIKDKYENYLKTKIEKKGKYNLLIENKTIFNLLIIMDLIIQILSNQANNLIEFRFSNITLKIGGIGEKNIFCFDSTLYRIKYYPDEIYINREKQNNVNYRYYFNQTENVVELVWYNHINDSQNMFNECPDITEIDV